jgi:hypothetical protein
MCGAGLKQSNQLKGKRSNIYCYLLRDKFFLFYYTEHNVIAMPVCRSANIYTHSNAHAPIVFWPQEINSEQDPRVQMHSLRLNLPWKYSSHPNTSCTKIEANCSTSRGLLAKIPALVYRFIASLSRNNPKISSWISQEIWSVARLQSISLSYHGNGQAVKHMWYGTVCVCMVLFQENYTNNLYLG